MQEQTSYGEAVVRKYPEQVAIAIAKDPQGKYNPITLGWIMPTSHNPPMMAVSVGLTRYSLEAIRLSREFVISFPSSEMAEDAFFYGTKSGRDMDKLAACGTKTAPASKVDGVLFSDAVANFECTRESECGPWSPGRAGQRTRGCLRPEWRSCLTRCPRTLSPS